MVLEEGRESVSMGSDCRSWVMGRICHRGLEDVEQYNINTSQNENSMKTVILLEFLDDSCRKKHE